MTSTNILQQADDAREKAHYTEAIALYDTLTESSAPAIASYSWQMIGVCHARLGEHSLAITCLQNAEVLYKIANDILGLARTRRDMADSYVAQKEYNLARSCLLSSSLVFRAENAVNDLVANTHFTARLERSLGDKIAESVHITEAFTSAKATSYTGEKLYIYLDYTSWLVRSGETWRARKLAMQCLYLSALKRSLPHVVRSAQMVVFASNPSKIQRALFGRTAP